MLITAYVLSTLCLLLNVSLFVRIRPPFGWVLHVLHNGLSPFLVAIGLLGAGLGWLSQDPIPVVVGLASAAISTIYIVMVTAPQPSFEVAFGKDWRNKIAPAQESQLLKRRWSPGLPRTGEPIWERDIPFWTIPGTDRKLLCDVWQPPAGIARTGLAFVYLHGSAWYILDKDYGTRPFFRQLTAQGHVIMDVAYRLCPEVDIYGMAGDVKRAVAWIKANAAKYQVNPQRIVLAGASAGGHLAMLAAYAPHDPLLTPEDVRGCDLSVRAVVSYYGPTDLRAVYAHTHQKQNFGGKPKQQIGLPGAAEMKKDMMQVGRLDTLLGGHLDEVPQVYELASPVCHVQPSSPPTLLFQGTLDNFVPVAATRELYQRLVQCEIPAAMIIYPLTNHAFDMLLPQFSPPTHAALYYLERFLALMV